MNRLFPGRTGFAMLVASTLTVPVAFAQDGSWTAKADTPDPIAEHGAVTVGDDVYLVGGRIDAGCPARTTDTLVYSLTADSWSRKPPLQVGRHGLGVAEVGGMIYAIGGGTCLNTYATTEVYNPATEAWMFKAPLPSQRVFMSTAASGETIYVISGSDGVTGLTTTTYRYDTANDTWSLGAPIPSGRYLSAAGVVDGIVYVVGGSDSVGTFPTTVYAYDPASDSWSTRAPMPTARQGLAVAVVAGILYAIGGQTQAGQNLATVEAYDPATDTWSTVTSIPGVGRAAAAGAGSAGGVFVSGGYSAFGLLTNHEMFTPVGPPVPVDTDGDGFADDVDACPLVPGAANGCPPPSIEGLIQDIGALALPPGAQRALSAALGAADAAMDRGNVRAARALLGVFVIEVRVLMRRGLVSEAVGAELIVDAEVVSAGL